MTIGLAIRRFALLVALPYSISACASSQDEPPTEAPRTKLAAYVGDEVARFATLMDLAYLKAPPSLEVRAGLNRGYLENLMLALQVRDDFSPDAREQLCATLRTFDRHERKRSDPDQAELLKLNATTSVEFRCAPLRD
jgi:hypothetical protein